MQFSPARKSPLSPWMNQTQASGRWRQQTGKKAFSPYRTAGPVSCHHSGCHNSVRISQQCVCIWQLCRCDRRCPDLCGCSGSQSNPELYCGYYHYHCSFLYQHCIRRTGTETDCHEKLRGFFPWTCPYLYGVSKVFSPLVSLLTGSTNWSWSLWASILPKMTNR